MFTRHLLKIRLKKNTNIFWCDIKKNQGFIKKQQEQTKETHHYDESKVII